jgi:uncharacterized SAM-binding protein YcdF (DUF218 family)
MLDISQFVKAFIAPLIEPLGAVWFLMLLCLLWLARKGQWRSAFWLGLPTAIIFLLGSTPLAETLVEWEEKPYTPASIDTLPFADAVVALGGGYTISAFDALGFSIGEAGDRNLTALQIVRLGKAKSLILGGSSYGLPEWPSVSNMSRIQDWILTWQLSSVAVTNLGICENTREEALQFCKMADAGKWQKVIVVTSALHMKRSEAVFHKLGRHVVPMACDFQVCGIQQPPNTFSPFPQQGRLRLLSLYFHEKIGWWVYRWRGWV